MSDYAKRLAAIETALAAWDWYCDDDADPAKEPSVGEGQALRDVEEMAPGAASWLLGEIRAASEALAAAGIPDDGRALAERVKALAAERNRLRAAIVGANNALAGVCHGDHEHQIECHADTLPAQYRRVAVAAEQASEILAEVVLSIVDAGAGAAPLIDVPDDLYQAHPLIWADRVKAMASAMPEAMAAVFRVAVDRAALVPGLEQANREAHRGITKLRRRLADGKDVAHALVEFPSTDD